MNSLKALVCPRCATSLDLAVTEHDGTGRIQTGSLACPTCRHTWPVVGAVPRFVPSEAYATNFGLQWGRFSRTQMDRFNGTSISSDWFYRHTTWTPETLRGQDVLDAGCGAGRFSQVALDAGARVTAVDLSSAAGVCRETLQGEEDLLVVQADLANLPFEPAWFDRIFCLGVLHHTPDPARILASFVKHLRPGGEIALWVYERTVTAMLHPKYVVRPLTSRLEARRCFDIVRRLTPILLPISNLLLTIPVIGAGLARAIPVANFRSRLPLSPAQLAEWSVLCTYDWLSPRYDRPIRLRDLTRWLSAAGCVNIRRTVVPREGLGIVAVKRS